MPLKFSFVIPIYNRPEEARELLQSLVEQNYEKGFEVVLVEDGSTERSEAIAEAFQDRLQISYCYKENSGPGDSRNYGMRRAKGDYFIILDSDCIIPAPYLGVVEKELGEEYVDFYGGPDAAHPSFSDIQKAIDFSMTSFLTTGGIRGGGEGTGKFQPRSFNMGISREAFEKSGGFGKIHPGEDPDLTLRLWEMGFESRLLRDAYVFHKRRIDWGKFFVQVKKFGMVRPILNKWHEGSGKISYWFPSIFIVGLLCAIIVAGFSFPYLLYLYLIYFLILLIAAFFRTGSFKIAFLSVFASLLQFSAYASGYLRSFWQIHVRRRAAEEAFPELFF